MCFLTAQCFKASLLQPETNEGVAVPYIQNETKEKKTKRTPAPNPGRPTDFSQAEGAAGVERAPLRQRASASGAAARIQSLGTQAGVLCLQGPGAAGVGRTGFALPSRGLGWGPSTRSGLAALRPGKHPLPLPESRECRWSGSSWTASGQRERSNLEFLGRFCTISPQAFQSREVEVHGAGGVRRKRPTSPGRLSRGKGPSS